MRQVYELAAGLGQSLGGLCTAAHPVLFLETAQVPGSKVHGALPQQNLTIAAEFDRYLMSVLDSSMLQHINGSPRLVFQKCQCAPGECMMHQQNFLSGTAPRSSNIICE